MRARLLTWLSPLLGVLLLAGLPYLALSQGPKVPADKALIVVKLPADAKLTIDGQPSKSTGAERRISASGLEAGKTYSYTLVATWNQDGKPRTETQKARFAGGQTVEVVFKAKKDQPPKDKDKKDKDKPKDKDDEAKKKDAAYKGAMTRAEAAMDAKKYADAIKAYDEALKAKPGDKAATDRRAAAVKAQDDAKKKKGEDDKKQADDKKKSDEAKTKEAAYQNALKNAKAAFDAKKYADAIKAYDEALKAKPGDATASNGKKAAAKAASDDAKKKADDKKKADEAKMKETAYQNALKNARAAFDAKKYADAIKAYDEALKAKPGDKAATDGKTAALKAQADEAKKKKDDEAKKKEDDKKKAEAKKKEDRYQDAIKRGKAAFDAKRYADAIKAYDEALKAKPGDKAATDGKTAALKAQADEAKKKADDKKKADETLGRPAIEKGTAKAKSRTFEFTYEATVTGLEKGKKARVWVPVARGNDDQEVKLLGQSVKGGEEKAAGKIGTEKRYGNRMFFVETTPDGAGKIHLKFTYRVTRREVKGETGKKQEEAARIKRFLQPDALVPIDGKPLELIKGKELPADPMKKARVLYDVVNDHMKYGKEAKGWGRGDAVWACDSKTGNCSDFHSLFISLSRSQKIPAKFEMGFPIPTKRGEGAVGGYHCWAFFKPEGKSWVPVDISEANKEPKLKDYYFGNLTEDRVTFTTGRDIDLEPKQAGKPINFLIYPHVEVGGKEHDQGKIEKKFSYKDVK